MATATETSYLQRVGETSGLIWHSLNESGPVAMSKLPKQIDAPRELVLMGLGWLAREGKIEIEEVGRKRIVSLS